MCVVLPTVESLQRLLKIRAPRILPPDDHDVGRGHDLRVRLRLVVGPLDGEFLKLVFFETFRFVFVQTFLFFLRPSIVFFETFSFVLRPSACFFLDLHFVFFETFGFFLRLCRYLEPGRF